MFTHEQQQCLDIALQGHNLAILGQVSSNCKLCVCICVCLCLYVNVCELVGT